jgi:uncharacterized membrane protein YphA (DoxX/SURF4 family)
LRGVSFGWDLYSRDLSVGWSFLWSGWWKLNNLRSFTSDFAGWGIVYPQVLARFVAGLEFFGGILLLLGLFTRIIAVPLAVVMVVATVVDKAKDIDSLAAYTDLIAVFIWLAGCRGWSSVSRSSHPTAARDPAIGALRKSRGLSPAGRGAPVQNGHDERSQRQHVENSSHGVRIFPLVAQLFPIAGQHRPISVARLTGAVKPQNTIISPASKTSAIKASVKGVPVPRSEIVRTSTLRKASGTLSPTIHQLS